MLEEVMVEMEVYVVKVVVELKALMEKMQLSFP